jgi:hypothetical protein
MMMLADETKGLALMTFDEGRSKIRGGNRERV